ncbi:hypothetical protein CCU68_19300 [Pseudomonas gingeri NCPPB 3146 = LMG 5327]|uniref:Uncharacterized protein n=1 Tax=Pseudomonas gingeri NCPPB 3146 = LMG 5327 TaxID=707248 RepID=A0ABX4Y2C3_9PSED|nr:hypothetical protein CCU68_19300 [Pseudomonas gingeri NCPPB 3146 = LMG 5327]
MGTIVTNPVGAGLPAMTMPAAPPLSRASPLPQDGGLTTDCRPAWRLASDDDASCAAAFAGKPAPTGWGLATDCRPAWNLVGAGLPAMTMPAPPPLSRASPLPQDGGSPRTSVQPWTL